MNNVFRKILQVEQLFPFFFQLDSLAPQRLRKDASQVGHDQKSEGIT